MRNLSQRLNEVMAAMERDRTEWNHHVLREVLRDMTPYIRIMVREILEELDVPHPPDILR